MPIHVAHPRLLIATLACGAIATSIATAMANSPGEQLERFSVSELASPTVSTDFRDAAEAFLRANDEPILAVNDGAEWTIGYEAPVFSQGQLVGIGFKVYWADPISSSGPWTALKCQGTRQFAHDVPYHDVRALSVVVALEPEPRIVELIPSGVGAPREGRIGDEAYFDRDVAEQSARLRITDLGSGELVATVGPGVRQDAVPGCPPQLADD